MIDREMQRKIRFMTSMSVGVRRAMGVDEDTIRRQTLDVAVKSIHRHYDDAWEQESMVAAIERAVDLAIAETR